MNQPNEEVIYDCYDGNGMPAYDEDDGYYPSFNKSSDPQEGKKNVAKAVIVVACIGLICAIIDFYVEQS